MINGSRKDYDGQRAIEVRNPSGAVLKQLVWGLQYVDELIQVGVPNTPLPAPGYPCNRFFWACQDANYNVLGLVSESGRVVERYEYTPYGSRKTYTHGWLRRDLDGDGVIGDADDTAQMAAAQGATGFHKADLNDDQVVNATDTALLTGASLPSSDPWVTFGTYGSFAGEIEPGGGLAPTRLCDFGHQGLMHDEEFDANQGGLIYNRARMRHPGLGRWMQREPLGYVDGMSLYQYVRAQPTFFLDPSGRQTTQPTTQPSGNDDGDSLIDMILDIISGHLIDGGKSAAETLAGTEVGGGVTEAAGKTPKIDPRLGGNNNNGSKIRGSENNKTISKNDYKSRQPTVTPTTDMGPSPGEVIKGGAITAGTIAAGLLVDKAVGALNGMATSACQTWYKNTVQAIQQAGAGNAAGCKGIYQADGCGAYGPCQDEVMKAGGNIMAQNFQAGAQALQMKCYEAAAANNKPRPANGP